LLLDSLQHIVASEPDMAVVGRVSARDSAAAARRSRADVVVVGQDGTVEADATACRLVRQLGLRVLTITDDGKRGVLYELRPQRIALGDMSADTLCKAIRGRDCRPDSNSM